MNVCLRAWRDEDAPALVAARWSNTDLDSQFGEVELTTETQAREFIAKRLACHDTAKNWAIVENGRAVGNVGLGAFNLRHGTAWAHYWLAHNARGRGYATGALTVAANWAFDNDLFRLELGHRVNNPASCRVARGAGFLIEGIERQKLRYGDERFDVEIHARLASDPEPKTARTDIFFEN